MNRSSSASLSQSILHDDLWKLMRRLSLPAILGMSINGINAFVDALFVGQFEGQQAVAAVSLAFPLMMITNGFSAMIGVGASSLLSRAIGAGDRALQARIFPTLVSLSVLVSALLTGLGVWFAPELIGFLGGTGEILTLGVVYYRIMMIGAFFRIFAVAANTLIRAEGKIKEAMRMMIIATVLNMVLNPLFLGLFGWGVAGAAWATVAAMAALSVFDLLYFLGGRASFPVDLSSFRLEGRVLRPILSVGVSAMMLQIMFFVRQTFVFKSLAYYGTDWDLALMGASYRILLLTIFPSFGFAQALQPVVGISYGAGDTARARRAFRIFNLSSTVLMLGLWAVILLFPEPILGLMLPDADFSARDLFNFRMMMATLPAFPIFFMATTLFQSVGHARAAAFLLVSRELLFFIPIVLVLPLFFGADGVYYAGVPVNILVFGLTVGMVGWQFRKWRRE